MTLNRGFTVKKSDYAKEFSDKPIDTISDVAFNQNNTCFAVSSWDKTVTIYSFDSFSTTLPFHKQLVFQLSAPVLSVCFFNNLVVAGCTNGSMVFFDSTTGLELTAVQAHTGGIKALANYENKVIISGSFDQSLKVWEIKDTVNLCHSITLPAKVYAMSLSNTMLGIGLSNKTIQIYNLLNITVPVTFSTRFSYSIRSISLCPDVDSFAAGSIEAKIEIFSRTMDSKRFLIRAHREQNKLYSVNSIDFCPLNHNVIVSGGSDGSLVWFDRNSRVKMLNETFSNSVTASSFSSDGRFYVFATGDDWSKGYTGVRIMPGLFVIETRNIPGMVK